MASLKKYHTRGKIEAGCDEAGRGCLAGPVVAAAVILPEKFNHKDLNDSKQLSERKRNELRPIIESEAISWAVGIVSVKEIDEINILNASFLAMHRAIVQLSSTPELLLIDGNRFNAYPGIHHQCIVQGDAIYRSIAAASVLAKTYRDEIMDQLHEEFPHYLWLKNKGYPTKAHRNAIGEYGASAHHRMSFTLLPGQLAIPFEA
jgi:ribonuclease HII